MWPRDGTTQSLIDHFASHGLSTYCTSQSYFRVRIKKFSSTDGARIREAPCQWFTKRSRKLINLSFVIGCTAAQSTRPSIVEHLAAVVATAAASAAVLGPSSRIHCSSTASHLCMQPALQVQALLTLFLQRTDCRLFLSHLPRWETIKTPHPNTRRNSQQSCRRNFVQGARQRNGYRVHERLSIIKLLTWTKRSQ